MSVVRTHDGRRTRWTRYCEKIADACELRDWTFTVGDLTACTDEEDRNADGRCATAYGRKLARIDIRMSLKPPALRYTLVHELLHCHTDPAIALVQNDLEELIEERVDRTFWLGFRRAFEYGIDGMASALAKHLPLPLE